MRSIFSESQINEEESRLFFTTICNKFKWKFRDYSLDNDIDGEIEFFEEVSKSGETVHETNAEFIKVQLKSTINLEIKGNTINFDCPVKFLFFADICEYPIILVLYDMNSKKAYWIWIQELIYKDLDFSNPNWRKNKKSVAIKIPLINEVLVNDKFSVELRKIAKYGNKEINQLRKKDYLSSYYTQLKMLDSSNATVRKMSVNILVEKSFSESKNAMRILIENLCDFYEKSDYFKNDTIKKFHTEEVEMLRIFIYNDIRQEKDGLYFCKAEFNKNKDKYDENIINKQFEDYKGIRIHWGDFPEVHLEERLSKGKYIDIIEKNLVETDLIMNKIEKYENDFKKNIIADEELISKILSFKDNISEIIKKYSGNDYLQPFECSDLRLRQDEMNIILESLGMDVENKELNKKNKLYKIENAIKEYKEKIVEIRYELKKAK